MPTAQSAVVITALVTNHFPALSVALHHARSAEQIFRTTPAIRREFANRDAIHHELEALVELLTQAIGQVVRIERALAAEV